MSYTYPLIIEPTQDLITKERVLIYLINAGITHANEFGLCNFLNAKQSSIEHLHLDSFEICYHISGRQVYRVEGRDHETKGGEVFLTFPNEPHNFGRYMEEKSTFYYFSFNCMPETKNIFGLDDETSDFIVSSLHKFERRHFVGNAELKRTLDNIREIYLSNSPIKAARIRCMLVEFFYQLIVMEKAAPQVEIPEDISRALTIIDNLAYSELTISGLAQEVNLSESRFKQKFKKFVGMAPNNYIQKNKINMSKELLLTGDGSITEISNALGFSSSQYFATVFKRFECVSPTEYRHLYKK